MTQSKTEVFKYPGTPGRRFLFIGLTPGPTVMYKGVKARVYAMSIDLTEDQWIAEIGTYTVDSQDEMVKLTTKKEWVYLIDCEPDMHPEDRNAQITV